MYCSETNIKLACCGKSDTHIFLPKLILVWDEYSDIQIYVNIFGRTDPFAKIFVDFSGANSFGYSFVMYLS